MIEQFICDVDGCLNDGVIYWGTEGKPFKAFGNYDHDGLKMLRNHIRIQFITADKSGWDISYSRIVTHMGFELRLVKEADRFNYVQAMGFDKIAYMGDGYYDAPILKAAAIGIAPKQARIEARTAAEFVTPSAGGHGAVMDACMYIIERMNISHGL
jgi:3-deoxy-D-manno-octulosonate 8-phosphate phosphatase (KDO 8-P phosphatase)